MLLLLLSGCQDVEDDHDHDHEHEVMTTITLTFSPESGGDDLVFSWADPEDDGSPVIDDIMLADGENYDVAMSVFNELEEPAEEVTPEILDEADQHQVFFTGSAVQGPATGMNASAVVEHEYADQDEGELPLGLSNRIDAQLGTGSGELIVTLRHMPPESGEAVKVAGLAEDVAEGGFGSIGGANDIQVTFPLTVE